MICYIKLFKMFESLSIKQAKEEFKKIADAFKERDNGIKTNKEKIARLEGAITILMKSQSHKVSGSLNKSQSNIETKIINRIRRSKKKVVISEIRKLIPSTTIQDIKIIIVDEKGLCSKASFYRYILSLKSQKLNETETELRLN